MNESDPPASGPPPEEHSHPSPGAWLMAERRNLGLSLGDIARQLKLSVRQVEALERDDYTIFAGPVFVRGFLRNYAKLLSLDSDELLAAATPAAAAATPSTVPPETAEERQPATKSERRPRSLTGVVLIVLVVVAVVLVASNAARDHRTDGAGNDSAASPASAPAAPVAQSESASMPSPNSSLPAEESSAPPSAAASIAPAPPVAATQDNARNPATPPTTSSDTAAAEAEPAKPHVFVTGTGPAQVHIVFEGESWVEVRDANGNRIFSRLNPPGTERYIRGTPPLSLVVGNAGSVKLLYHEKPVDLQPHTKIDVARITLE